jgi:hypothetical protein
MHTPASIFFLPFCTALVVILVVVAITGGPAVRFCELLACAIAVVEFSTFAGGTVRFCEQVMSSTIVVV